VDDGAVHWPEIVSVVRCGRAGPLLLAGEGLLERLVIEKVDVVVLTVRVPRFAWLLILGQVACMVRCS
jgi:hypothetical protein